MYHFAALPGAPQGLSLEGDLDTARIPEIDGDPLLRLGRQLFPRLHEFLHGRRLVGLHLDPGRFGGLDRQAEGSRGRRCRRWRLLLLRGGRGLRLLLLRGGRLCQGDRLCRGLLLRGCVRLLNRGGLRRFDGRSLRRFFRRLYGLPGRRFYRNGPLPAVLEDVDAQDHDHDQGEDSPAEPASHTSQPVENGIFRARLADLLLRRLGRGGGHGLFNIFCVSRQDRACIHPQKPRIGLDEGLCVDGLRQILKAAALDGFQERRPDLVPAGHVFQPEALRLPDAFQLLEKLVSLQLRFIHGFACMPPRFREFWLGVSPICEVRNRKCPGLRGRFFSSQERPDEIR